MEKAENKELTFEEMEAQLFYAYQQEKYKYLCDLEFLNDKERKTIILFVKDKKLEKTVIKSIYGVLSYKDRKKSFNEMIEILNGEEPEWNARVVCISSNVIFKKGKTYKIKNGYLHDGYRSRTYCQFKNIDELNNYYGPQFVELVE